MQATLGSPILIFIYSVALLLIGCAIGMHWRAVPCTAIGLALIGGVAMVIHDTATAILWFIVMAKLTLSRPNPPGERR
jgi:hypothetical protein